jgi:hypothetical protein
MGFFSRIFKMDASPESPTLLPVDSAGQDELQLDSASAEAILAELDIDTAIAAHENWKLRLQNYLDGKSTEDLKPEVVCLDDRCDLGKWLHGPGKMRLGAYPAFSILIARHKYFHVQASSVVALAQAGENDKARQTLGTSYRHGSNQVVLLLKELKRGLGR